MLCCVSRRTVSGADQGSLYDHYLTKVQPVESGKVVEFEKCPEPDVPPILQPCAICARTFKPQSLEKHTKICEQTACKKRKPFDSAKQRIQGTELAEFLPRQEKRRHTHEDRSGGLKSSWKQTHDDFLRQIRAARNENVDDTMQKPGTTLLLSSAPMRANEQGVCPTCNRHFGIKAYDRHVAWCKEKIARVQTSPATSIAKERLEARMKYRAPSLKNRRQITREKYSPTSATNLHSSSKTSPTQHSSRAKGSTSAPNCNKGNDSPVKQKAAAVRRAGQSKGGSSPIGPMKSRPIDRSNRLSEEGSGPVTFPPALLNKRTLLPVPPLKYKKQSVEEYNIVSSPKRKLQTRMMAKQLPNYRAKPDDGSQLSGRSMRSSIVSSRSEGHPKLNDLSINVDVMGMTVKPCNLQPKNSLTTWKKISQAKDRPGDNIERVPSYKPKPGQFFLDQEKEPTADSLSSEGQVNWQSITPRLNRTYSFKDSSEDVNEALSRNRRRKRVKNSPRIEFCFGDLEKLERLRQSHYQRNVEDEKVASISKDSLKDLSCEMDWKSSRRSARSKMLERRRLNLPCDQLASQDEDRRSDSFTIVYPRNNTSCDSIGVASREESSPQELPLTIDDEQIKVPKEFDELGERRKDESLSGRLSKGEYRPRATDVLKVREDNDVNFELPSPVVAEQIKVPEEFHDSLSGRLSRGEYRPRTTDVLKVKEDNDVYFELPSPIVDEEIKLPKEFHNSLSGRLSRGTYQPKATDVLKVREDNDVNFATDELDPPTKFCYLEGSLTEMDPESILMKDVLRPSRSSTPFDKSTNWREQSMTPPPNKWEMAVNEETGSELLYRVEVEEENLSGCNDISNSDCLATNHCSDNKPTAAEEIKAPLVNRKDIASQATICKCSPRVIDSSSPIDEDIKEPEETKEENLSSPGIDYKEDGIDPDDLPTFPNSVLETIKIGDEEVHEIYKNFSSKDFDCPSDDSIDGMPRSVENDPIGVRDLRSMILSESHVTVKKSANAAFKSRYSKVIGIENRILEHVNEANDSNDSLSMIDGVDLASVKQVETVEVETIEEIGTGSRNVRFGVLPDIKRTTIVVKKDRNKSETITTQTYWEKASNTSKNRLINLDLPYQESSRLLKRNPKVLALPPVSSNSFLTKRRNVALPLRPVWSNYVRRRPDFNLVLSSRTGKDYNPFLLAEQQMNDLLSDASEQSVTDSPLLDQNRETSVPLSHSSAFVKYRYQTSPSNPGKRSSLIAPPTEFDDLVSEFSSDSTETNSLCREVYLKDDKESKSNFEKKSPARELGRRVIIDKSKALGGDVTEDNDRGSRSFVGNSDRARKILDKVSPKVIRPTVNRSFSVRASSAPKTSLDKKNNCNDAKKSLSKNNDPQRSSNASLNNRNNNYVNLSTSNLSLSSIVSSDVDIKRSNSVFDELMTSFDDENSSFASLKSLLKSDSLSVSSPVHGRQRNEHNSDEELSSPESYKRQDHGKFSGDSAYSSLNRKYSHHGRSTNDVAGRLDEDYTRQNRGRSDGEGILSSSKCKMSKFCHECGSKFQETAKFCCECGIRRLVL